MRKFTVFSVILSVVVVVVVAEIVSSDYLSQFKKPQTEGVNNQANTFNLPDSIDLSKNIQTSVIGADGGSVDENSGVSGGDGENKLGYDLESANIEASGDSAYLQQDYENASGNDLKDGAVEMKKISKMIILFHILQMFI